MSVPRRAVPGGIHGGYSGGRRAAVGYFPKVVTILPIPRALRGSSPVGARRAAPSAPPRPTARATRQSEESPFNALAHGRGIANPRKLGHRPYPRWRVRQSASDTLPPGSVQNRKGYPGGRRNAVRYFAGSGVTLPRRPAMLHPILSREVMPGTPVRSRPAPPYSGEETILA